MGGVVSNRDGYGTKVWVTTGDKTQVRELISGAGYFFVNAKELYFGLDEADCIDLIEVRWTSGINQTFRNVNSKQTVLFKEEQDESART